MPPNQCHAICCGGNRCIMPNRAEHYKHVCDDRDCACHNSYHARVNVWLERQIVSYPQDFARALESYNLWQSDPCHETGSGEWRRSNGNGSGE